MEAKSYQLLERACEDLINSWKNYSHPKLCENNSECDPEGSCRFLGELSIFSVKFPDNNGME